MLVRHTHTIQDNQRHSSDDDPGRDPIPADDPRHVDDSRSRSVPDTASCIRNEIRSLTREKLEIRSAPNMPPAHCP